MAIVSWLLLRVAEDDNEKIKFNTLYNAFHFEMLESDRGSENIPTKKHFADHILKVFPNAVKCKSRTDRKYKGIRLRRIDATEPIQHFTWNLDQVFALLSSNELESLPIQNLVKNADSVNFSVSTNTFSDDNEIMKDVSLLKDGTWSLSVGVTQINLISLNISENYEPTLEILKNIVKSVSIIRLCNGVNVTHSVLASRFHVLNRWTTPESVSRQLHSAVCSKVVPFTYHNKTCRKCSKMIINVPCENTDNEKSESESEIENVQNTDDKSHTRQNATRNELEKMIPEAKPELIDMLLSQTENANKHPKARRWSESMMTFCLQWYCKSPQSYLHVRDSGYLVLPSRSVLISFKTRA